MNMSTEDFSFLENEPEERVSSFSEFILVKVYRPEGYEDVCDELLFVDVIKDMGNEFTVELYDPQEGIDP